MSPTFETKGDGMPPNNFFGYRKKFINEHGVTGNAMFVPSGTHPFTGLLKEGGDHCFIRLSYAK